MTYSVSLEVFEGPLDLLLQLVSKERLDIADVSISTITDEYLRAVKQMGEIELEVASSFLVLAATLLELKSIKLLPKRVIDDPELAALLEERDHLLHRLIEYSTFKSASVVFSSMLDANVGYFSRDADLPPELAPSAPDVIEGITPERLARAAARLFAPKSDVAIDTSHVTPIRVSVGEMVDLLIAEIKARGTTLFSELKQQSQGRIDVVVRFLALLELFKRQSVELEQAMPFGDIVIRWREPLR
ncbi:MAG: ScpA family protein [Actinomycetota bacterium]|nr:segregation/condensation protein A [Actinomycetota bacterium]